ncbi:MAG TPA: hypothetical protein VHW02_07890 [Rhizomicrobium sp.]|jgi:prophage tail gpP-like protein|nr:hypothetical protein [Rhizomicrobium sp.]
MTTEDLTLAVGGKKLSGWTRIRVTRSIERFPSDFDIELTELFPDQAQSVVVTPGDSCEVYAGSDLVVTGYVDAFAPSFDPENHSIRVTGRGKCQDMLDCAAEWPNGQISGATARDIAVKLAQPYGITVVGGADPGPVIPQFNLIIGETAYEVVERVARYRALLVYEDENGNMVLDRAASDMMASGFSEGVNVISAAVAYSMDQRYSDYWAFLNSVDTYGDSGEGGNIIKKVTDAAVKRHRLLTLIAEAGDSGGDVAQRRAIWEMNRRAGRSMRASIKADSWRDAEGELWTPNKLAAINLPSLKTANVNWLISDVTYTLDEEGTSADLILMPPQAFDIEPVLLNPTFQESNPGGT